MVEWFLPLPIVAFSQGSTVSRVLVKRVRRVVSVPARASGKIGDASAMGNQCVRSNKCGY